MFAWRGDRRDPAARGFTLVELLVALAIGASVLTVAVMVFQNVASGARPGGTFATVDIGAAAGNFYAMESSTLDAWVAPNYGRRAQADLLRDAFWDDVSYASAVFCLSRATGVLNTVRPSEIPVPASLRGQQVDMPNRFQALLISAFPAAATVFSPYRGAAPGANASIFVLQPSEDESALSVRAVYDVDFIELASPPGTYASVRRYVGGELAEFYDVFYPAGAGAVAFSPVVVAFERAARAAFVEGSAIDRLKVAGSRPFYFIWWPDPAAADLKAATPGTFAATDPRASYANMGGRTSLFFVVPMFPPL